MGDVSKHYPQRRDTRPNVYWNDLCRLSVIVAQQATKTLSSSHFAYWATDSRFGGNQLIIQSLMISFTVIRPRS
jgi:hypothetical protein